MHLGLGSTATVLPDFTWTPECLASYATRFASDGDEGRLVCITEQPATWDTWERHPAGEEVVVLLSGRIDLVQDLHGVEHAVSLRPGEAMVNPVGVWHTAPRARARRRAVHHPGGGNGAQAGSPRLSRAGGGFALQPACGRSGARSCGPCGG